MSKGNNNRILKTKDINWNNFKILRINKNNSIIFRCKYCRGSRLKKFNNKVFKISGHSTDCDTIKRKNNLKESDLNDPINFNDKINEKQKKFKLNINKSTLKEKKKDNNIDISDIYNIKHTKNTTDELSNQTYENGMKLFSLLINVFDKNNNLNKYQEEMGLYYINKKKLIGEGSYTKVFLGEDKIFRFNVAILQMDLNNEESFAKESFILHRINNKGNFPKLYNTYTDDKYYYLVENLMGPDLKKLHELCDLKFDYFTVINIAIDLIKNIQILHNSGFIHRDLKPDNIVFGNLCYENNEKRKEIGIIDFSNAKINIKSNGSLNYSNKKVGCMGNKYYSSTTALEEKDVTKKDDLISIIYIIIYLYVGKLPWIIRNSGIKKLTKKEIIEIRKSIGLKELCSNFPINFINLVEFIFQINENETPDYNYILNELEKLKSEEEKKYNNKKEKFCWITLLKKYANRSSEINKSKRKKIKLLMNKYNIKLEDYLIYITS